MLFIKTYDIGDQERAFLFRRNRFAGILDPGRYRFLDLMGDIRLERFDITKQKLNHGLAKLLVTTFKDLTQDYLEAYQLAEMEVGLVYQDGVLKQILEPGSFSVFWKGVEDQIVERINIAEDYRVDQAHLTLLGRGQKQLLGSEISAAIYYSEIPDQHAGLQLENGKFIELLEPGAYGFWKFQRNIAVHQVDLRIRNLEITGQEILTKDRVSLRLNLSTAYQVIDPVLVSQSFTDVKDYMHREFQLQLREVVGTRTLDELLADKDALNRMISEGIRDRVESYGISIKNVGVRDIILPGDMKVILNQVVEAQKAAEANLIKRREETAATRSLHNTAKVMEDNPTLMRLKELEVLEKVTSNIGNINVYSGLEGVMKDLIKTPSL